MKAVVTGGAGFIGSHVVKELLSRGYTVTVIDNLKNGKRENIPPLATFVHADIRDFESIAPHIKKGDIIFHLAALTSVPQSINDPLTYHETNIKGTYNILEAARVKEAHGVVFSSSAAVYGNQDGEVTEDHPTQPMSPYAFQKHFGEQLGMHYAKHFNVPFIALRYFNVFGDGNHETGSYAPVTALFLRAKREQKPLPIIGDGGQTRDFINVKDVAKANVKAGEAIRLHSGNIFNVSSGQSVSIIEIAELIGGERTHLPPRQEIRHSRGNSSKIQKLLDFQPTISIQDWLKDILS